MRCLSKLILLLAALGVVATSAAQDDANVYDRVDLSASVEREIDNDLLVAVVFAEVEANNQADAANRVNQSIQWAIDRVRAVTDVELETGRYNTRPVYVNGRRITGWVARQSLRLESRNAGALSELLGELQERVAIESINYDISKAARDAAEDALIAEALQQFNRRAELVARELGRESFRIVRIGIGTSGGRPMPMFRQDALAASSVAAPPIEAGVQTVTVSVNGTVELNGAR
jgi:predicted secreted protein